MQNNLYNNKYKINSTRLCGKDYSDDGKYFVTICTQNRKFYFGKVVNEKMILNDVGKIVNAYWNEIPQHFKDIRLLDYIIMPNHIHGIIEIEHNYKEYLRTGIVPVYNKKDEAVPRLYRTDKDFYKKISLKPNSISAIIGSFKSICTKNINKKYPNLKFAWQPLFYEHIIKSDDSLENIIYYIHNNPLFWYKDRNNPINFNKK